MSTQIERLQNAVEVGWRIVLDQQPEDNVRLRRDHSDQTWLAIKREIQEGGDIDTNMPVDEK